MYICYNPFICNVYTQSQCLLNVAHSCPAHFKQLWNTDLSHVIQPNVFRQWRKLVRLRIPWPIVTSWRRSKRFLGPFNVCQDCICCLLCVFSLPGSKQKDWSFHLSQAEIAINFIISPHLCSQSQGAPPAPPSLYPSPHLLALSSAPPILKSSILLALFTVFPLAVSCLFLSTRGICPLHSPAFIALIYWAIILRLFFYFFSLSVRLLVSNRGVGKVEKVTFRDEWSLYQSGISSSPD